MNTYQNDTIYPQEIIDTGCHYFCFLYSIEKIMNCKLFPVFINNLFIELRDKQILTKESYVMWPQMFLNEMKISADYLGIKPKDFPVQKDDIVILMYEWREKGFKHFVIGNPDGTVIYDPIKDGSQTVKYGEYKNMRIIRPRC